VACYVCYPNFAGDETSRNAANDVRSSSYKLFSDLSGIKTCDAFNPRGSEFQKNCKTTEADKNVVCTTITNGKHSSL
jgi:hypothetical protein